MTIFFTADLHFNHRNVIKYCNRPYKDVDEMNDMLVQNWNDRVDHDDFVYVLGDFAFGNTKSKIEWALRLKGHKYIVIGNHDDKSKSFWARCGFEVVPQGPVAVGMNVFNVSHYPYANTEFDERNFSSRQLQDDGKFLLHGHVHNAWLRKDKMINVGVDVWDYKPVNLTLIEQLALNGPIDGGRLKHV